MRRLAAILVLSVASIGLLAPAAEAQQRRRNADGLIIRVEPRSFLDAGKVVPVGSLNYPTSGRGQTASYLNSPPYIGMRDAFGAGTLPDPILNSPFVGGRNPFDQIDFFAPFD